MFLCPYCFFKECLYFSTVVDVKAAHLFSQTYRLVKVSENGEEVAQDITHDVTENTVTIAVGDVSMYPDFISTINFHDFNTVTNPAC